MVADIQKLTQDYKAGLQAHRDELKQQLDRTEKLLELINSFPLSQVDSSSTLNIPSLQSEPNGNAVEAPRKAVAKQGGLPDGLTRRQAVTQIIDELDSDNFIPLDVREKYVERYPQIDTKNLAPSISTLLRQMSERGEIKRLGRRGDSHNDPYVYKKVNNTEERLGLDP